MLQHDYFCSICLVAGPLLLCPVSPGASMLPHRWLLLLLLAASVAAAGETNMSLGSSSARPRHNLAHLWPWQSVVGLVGVVLNSAVFYAFIRERQNMARPVNVLVWWVIGYLISTVPARIQPCTGCKPSTVSSTLPSPSTGDPTSCTQALPSSLIWTW